ncbi:MAG: hypothetical protein RJA99_1217 [Pseudomonadota bacterium]|jgi:hypothetical protein
MPARLPSPTRVRTPTAGEPTVRVAPCVALRDPARRGAFAAAASLALAVVAPSSARAARPELLQGDWALVIDGDSTERMLTISMPVALSGGLRFEAGVSEGRRARSASGTVRQEAGTPVMTVPLAALGRLTLRQAGVDRWDGQLVAASGAVRPARIVRYAPEEPPTLLLARQAALRPDSRVRVLYFGADDCVYCRSWEGASRQEGAFLASETARRVELIKVKRPRTVQPPGIDALPSDLQARVPAEPRLASFLRAAPGWLVVVDEDVVLSRMGLGAWSREVEPFVAALAQRLGSH